MKSLKKKKSKCLTEQNYIGNLLMLKHKCTHIPDSPLKQNYSDITVTIYKILF